MPIIYALNRDNKRENGRDKEWSDNSGSGVLWRGFLLAIRRHIGYPYYTEHRPSHRADIRQNMGAVA